MTIPLALAVVSVLLLLVAARVAKSDNSIQGSTIKHRHVLPERRRATGSAPIPSMQVAISLIVLIAGLYIILNQSYSADDKR